MRFATFAHAISSTPNTAPSIVSSIARACGPIVVSICRIAVTPMPWFDSGWSVAIRCAMSDISVCAVSSETPSRSRPMA
jgi:hypothetical protein